MENFIDKILSAELQEFLQKHQTLTDFHALALQAPKFPKVDIPLAINQLKARQKAMSKLPMWFQHTAVVYPPLLSMEQCSSENTAQWKKNWLADYLKNTITKNTYKAADLTGGFGVDAWYLAQDCEQFFYVEQQSEVADVAKYNFELFQAKNIRVLHQNSVDFLQQLHEKLDFIYLDPARRNQQHQKVFHLADCEPNILEIMPLLQAKTQVVLLKVSPLLDIHLAMEQLPHLQAVAVVAVENECKELLFILDFHQKTPESIKITTVNIQKNNTTQDFSYWHNAEKNAEVHYDFPLLYLYEPNAAVLKAGAFRSVAAHYNLKKLHLHSHLYTSNELHTDFTGRIFEVKGYCKLDKKILAHQLRSEKANITARNFPLSVEEIRKKTGLKDGGEAYLFATTLIDESKSIVITEKVIIPH
jgi:hypothetical protein